MSPTLGSKVMGFLRAPVFPDNFEKTRIAQLRWAFPCSSRTR